MSIAPEQVEAPATDAVLFRSSPIRTFVAIFLLLMVSFAAVSPIVAIAVGGTGNPWWQTFLQAAVICVLAAGAYAWSTRGSLTTWVRVSSGGLEVAAQGSDPILLDWPDIESLVVRRQGIRTLLEVTPVDLDRVHPVDDDGGPGGPAMTLTGDGPAFTADLSEVWPGPRALKRELARHMPSKPIA
ncbi:hypothetical protein GCM10010172_24360 [Paractinoplanes ferrugineus]|uniref:PH domain-containing protein n=1 Tax=Paractinoplanes ferrugineus TaxID=113564 RepID=A0A919IWL8_9ACTN|nr:hypothetical protein [Actinoplanes ferrugineus]GIE08653.1 hypothetical protein Afe05nite_04930 [Actinoplanes ferrugineus]